MSRAISNQQSAISKGIVWLWLAAGCWLLAAALL
jgi:hypothetical protein